MKYRIPPADQGNLNICAENLLQKKNVVRTEE